MHNSLPIKWLFAIFQHAHSKWHFCSLGVVNLHRHQRPTRSLSLSKQCSDEYVSGRIASLEMLGLDLVKFMGLTHKMVSDVYVIGPWMEHSSRAPWLSLYSTIYDDCKMYPRTNLSLKLLSKPTPTYHVEKTYAVYNLPLPKSPAQSASTCVHLPASSGSSYRSVHTKLGLIYVQEPASKLALFLLRHDLVYYLWFMWRRINYYKTEFVTLPTPPPPFSVYSNLNVFRPRTYQQRILTSSWHHIQNNYAPIRWILTQSRIYFVRPL